MVRIGFRRFCLVQPDSPGCHPRLPGALLGIAVTLVEAGTSRLVDSLRAARVDAAFIRSPSREVDGLFVVSILEEDMLIAVPSRHDLAASATLAREALSGQPFILFPRGQQPGILRQYHTGLPTRRL